MRKQGAKSTKYSEVMDAGWDVLAAAIVMTAYSDFLLADRKMKDAVKNQATLSVRSFAEQMNIAARMKRDVRKFFYSSWYSDICGIDRYKFLNKLDEVEAEA